ncbi:MAG: DNA polymerase III subunit delta [bacterium]|nr:DNA polymerase III subunit delta [bacterium]
MKEADQILLDLKRKIYKPIYFLSGEEPHYIDVISDYIEQHVLSETDREFNQTVVYGKDVDLGGILALAKQFPMMSEYNVVIVKEAQNIKELNKKADEEPEPGDASKTSTSSGTQQFLHYINNPQPSTILVFGFKYKTLDKRSALAKALQKKAVYLESAKLYDNQVPEWVGNYVKEKGYTIGPKAIFLLSEFLGSELSKISNEIDKLLISLPAGKEITAELVQDNIGISKDFNVFELQDALAKKDVLKANRIINYFASNEKQHAAPMVLGMLYSYFSKIFRYHFLADKSKFGAAKELGVNPYFVDGLSRAAANYNSQKLRYIFSCLKEYDLKSKGVDNTSITYGELMKELVFKILH